MNEYTDRLADSEFELEYTLNCQTCEGKRIINVHGLSGQVSDKPQSVKKPEFQKEFTYNISVDQIPYIRQSEIIGVSHLVFVHGQIGDISISMDNTTIDV